VGVMKVGLIGLGRGGGRVAQTLLASSWCELIAVGSPKSKRIEQFTEEHPGIATYDDFRSMIVANPLDALFVAVPPYMRSKYLALAADRAIPVWMITPAARRFDEAIELLTRFDRAECPIVVSRSWGIEPAMQPDGLGLDTLGRFFFARGNVTLCWDEDFDWRGDSQRAGGGVLLYRAYPMIDAIVQAMGMPSTVYAKMAGVSRPGGRFPYDTEDTAGLICHFSGGGIAVISACWTAGPPNISLDLHATNGAIHVDVQQVIVRDRPGETELSRQPRPPNPLQPQIEGFLSELAASPRRIRATLRQHLPTIAVIEAVYLSARNGQPESPGTIFEIHDVRE